MNTVTNEEEPAISGAREPVISTFFVFDCPFHGLETGVHCFRAFAKENRQRWQKHICRERMEVSEDWYVLFTKC